MAHCQEELGPDGDRLFCAGDGVHSRYSTSGKASKPWLIAIAIHVECQQTVVSSVHSRALGVEHFGPCEHFGPLGAFNNLFYVIAFYKVGLGDFLGCLPLLPLLDI